MALVLDPPPAKGVDLINTSIDKLKGAPLFYTLISTIQQGSNALHATAAHPVFTIDLDAIVDGRNLAAVRGPVWRYLLSGGHAPVAAAELQVKGGVADKFSGVNLGPFVGGTATAIAIAEKLPNVQSGSYRLAMIRVPALALVALWLRGSDGAHDLLLPVAPAPPVVTAGRSYGVNDFFAALKPAALKRVKSR